MEGNHDGLQPEKLAGVFHALAIAWSADFAVFEFVFSGDQRRKHSEENTDKCTSKTNI